MTLRESTEVFIENKCDYYNQWVYDEPLLFSGNDLEKLERLQKIIYRLISHFVSNYKDYAHLVPLNKNVLEVLKILERKPYKVGTYRTDFVFDNEGQIKLIEITSRFALNGVFLSGLMNELAKKAAVAKGFNPTDIMDPYEPIYEHLSSTYLNGVNDICILTGDDKRNESKIYIEIFERAGFNVYRIPYNSILEYKDLLQGAWVISELSFDEILSIPKTDLIWLSGLNVTNDFRTVFLTHDKRFFSVLCDLDFQKDVLDKEDMLFLEPFLVPTFTSECDDVIWEEAKADKNSWIIKHRALGKSQSVYAGIVTEDSEWEKLFNKEMKRDFVLQKWISQKTIKGRINDQEYNDYITGTLLFFDDNFFGFGDFRTSSYPVTNVVDHRKATSFFLKSKVPSTDTCK